MKQNRPVMAFLSLVLVYGCGKGADGPSRQVISGTVIYDSKPVPRGSIFFEPDASAGANGPQGYAEIHDGKYSTSASGGKGAVAGAQIVRIEGFGTESEAVLDSSGEKIVPKLFEEYKTTVTLPEGNSEQNFEVPAAGQRAVKPISTNR